MIAAFTASPAPATATLFGAPFDTYSEAEAIAEGYIVDVASSIISYKTLYNLHCPVVPKVEEEKHYPAGVVAKALQNVAFQDDDLIQYKAEVMLRISEKDVMPLIDGRAQAMIVTSSRIAGLRYFQLIKEKLKERDTPYKALYAFSDFVHPATNAPISEHAINGANEILNIRVVSIGLIDRSPVHPREVFADALSDRASAVIVAHNHPSGGVGPSASDISITAQLKAAGEIIGVELLDHIIFNRSEYFSFLEAGRL